MPTKRADQAAAASGYHSPLRVRQAAATRAAVLTASSKLFTDRGWAATTIASVAAEAGTAVETVYAGFGSKSGLLTSAIDAALVGDDEPATLAERPQYADLGVGSRSQRLSAAAHLIALIHGRSVPLLRALQEAAASDEAAAARWGAYESDRRTEIAQGLALVLDKRPAHRLVDAVWAISGPEVYAKLVIDQGWSVAGYERWLVEVVGPLAEGRGR